MADTRRETLQFYGRVQGVGFRYATLQLAKEFEVTGFVKNQQDGSVLLEVQGNPMELRRFVESIEDRMHGYIRRIERSTSASEITFQGFEIR